jgi:hypothetical protein
MVPTWFHWVSIAGLLLGAACTMVIAVDETRRPQPMWIMAIVWPVTALFGTLATLWLYFQYGRASSGSKHHYGEREQPFPATVAKGALHCGAGCTLGDIIAEWLAFAFPLIAVWFGWQSFTQEKMFAIWGFDFMLAFLLGIAFQYFTIKPMRDLSPGQGLVEAVKADTLSLTAWQIGMYGMMAVGQFLLFRGIFGTKLEVDTVEFWFVMQIAMIAGFCTSYPANWWLIRRGIKEKM